MEHKDKKIKLDLDFLDEAAPEKTERKTASKDSGPTPTLAPVKSVENAPISSPMKWIFGISCVVILLLIIAVAAAQQASNTNVVDNPSVVTPTRPTPTSTPLILPTTLEEKTVPKEVVDPPPVAKTPNQICKEDYGSHSYSTGGKNASGGPVCDCDDGYDWNDSRTACVVVPVKSGLEICQERNGSHATYDSASNSCGCAEGYNLGSVSEQCVTIAAARDEGCAQSYPGTSFLKYDTESGKNICDCKSGYDWNDDRTACYTTASFNQGCVKSYGQGAYSTTENGKRVCDCGSAYAWNPQRTSCESISSINALCERDVGRNSRYAGSSSDGTYDCTEPY